MGKLDKIPEIVFFIVSLDHVFDGPEELLVTLGAVADESVSG